ncbi:two-component system, sporulation sensor kinase A [Mariprofundus micogutta]|uniref:histidine kinase n=1 Tax=Mariprofundus micogutta TaxID=1921010 RepID=A0A1L8CK12_9PROT|nr:ATP-binding protein [Mariprofundus micogutta]GAV19258.1 two-component system, sporulation sensor kinase A [Mariprofundus micogutta]
MAKIVASSGLRQVILQMNPLQLSILVAIPFVMVFSAINFTLGLYELWQIEVLMILTLSGLYFWSKRKHSQFLLKNLFVLHPVILFSFLFLQGGYSEIGFIWSFGFPFIACLSAGSRIGMAWTLVYAVLIAALGFGMEDIGWQKVVYIGLAYLAFSLIAFYTVIARETSEQLKELRLNETTSRLKHEEHALANSKISHRELLNALPHAIAVFSENRWIYSNWNTTQLLGVDSVELMIGTSLFDYVDPDDHARLNELISHMSVSNRPASLQNVRLLRKTGEPFIGLLHLSPVDHEGQAAFLVAFEDSSQSHDQEEEKISLQAQLEHAQRLESLGVLAGGIAHDFNNILAAIMGNAELARRKLDVQSPGVSHLENILSSCDHAAELCKQMLAYAGKGSYEIEVINLNELIKVMGKLIRASVSSNISLKMKLDDNLPGIEGDQAQVQQLLLNFIVNSAEAIGKQPGEIKVSTGAKVMTRETLDHLYNGTKLPEREYVIIEVRDDGCGMPEAVKNRIFDPFFTTKDTGSGLGLSAVLGIVRGHHGAIQLLSESGKGTAFRVYFPSTDQSFKERMATTMEVEAWHGDGTVLIVDDDLRVRTVASSFIENLDFDVLSAEDGKEGLALFKEHHHKLVAVLLDMTMPVMGGVEAMIGMRECDRSVPIVLISGYSETEAGQLVSGDRPNAFLQKPFKAKDLKSTLYEIMHEQAD